MANPIDFDFDAAIAEKNRFACRPAKERTERPVDLITAKMLALAETKPSLQDVRLLIAVERTNYRDYLANLMAVQTAPDCQSAPLSRADANILNAASAWKQQLQAVAIFSCYSEADYSEVCPLGIRLMGSGLASEEALRGQLTSQTREIERKMLRLAADFCPTHIVMSTPNYRVLSWANRCHINSIVLLPNAQAPHSRQQRQQHRALIKQLNQPPVKWVGNRGSSDCEIAVSNGIATDKLIPWKWPSTYNLNQHPPKELASDRPCTKLLYAGLLTPSSRVGDLLAALRILKQKEHPATLQIVVDQATSESALDSLLMQAQQLEVTESITLFLADSIEQLLAQVRNADAVIMPGHLLGHEARAEPPAAEPPIAEPPAAEPPAIVQVARAACTPIVASDRIEFKDYLMHGVNAMIFPEGNEKSMVHRIERLMGQPQLYAQLSEASNAAQSPMATPVTWSELVERWICDRPMDRQWLRNHAFSSGRYQKAQPFVA